MKCFLCNGDAGNGIEVLGKKLCSVCEHEVVNTSIDNPRYIYHLDSFKELWVDYFKNVVKN